MCEYITIKSEEKKAWFWADSNNVTDSLRVIFEDELIAGKTIMESWIQKDPDAKEVRMRAIDEALHDITIDKVTFANPEARPACDDITNLYELFKLLQEHPEARLTDVYYVLANECFSMPSIGTRDLLAYFAEDIAEDILDIEAELYPHMNDDIEEKLLKLDSAIARGERICGSDDKVVCAAKKARDRIIDEISPVEDFKAFMKEQYDKHKDQVDAKADAYNYVANQGAIDTAYDDEIKAIKRYSDNDPVNHPKHYQASNGLEAIDCIEAFVEDLPGDIGYLIGNAMKYLCRFDKKGKPVEDLQKARWYIERAIKDIESRKM